MKDIATILDVIRALRHGPEMPKLPEDASPLHVLAHEYALGCAEDELLEEFLLAQQLVEDGEYKHVRVNMRDVNGNTLVIVGVVKTALVKAKVPRLHVQIFLWEVLRGDYENAIRTCAKWVTIVDEPIKRSGEAALAFKGLL